ACPGGDRCDLFGSTLVLESTPIRALTSTERMTPRICPKCQRPQAWEMWRHCPCGYDFGPPRPGYSMEPEPKHRAREKVLSVADWDSPEHAVRSIRRAMIVSWVTWPSIVIGFWISRKSLSEDMRDLSLLVTMLSLPLLRWLLRRNVPRVNTHAMQIEWAALCLFVFAMGLLAAGVVNNDIMSA